MNIELIEQSAKVHLKSIGDEVEKQWKEQGVIDDTQGVYAGVLCENGAWYIHLSVYKKPSNIKLVRGNVI